MPRPAFRPTWWLSPVFALILFVVLLSTSQVLNKWMSIPEQVRGSTVAWTLGLVCSVSVFGVIVASLVAKSVSTGTLGQEVAESERVMAEVRTTADNLGKAIAPIPDQLQGLNDQIESLRLCSETLRRIISDNLGSLLINHEDMKQVEASVADGGEIWILTAALQLEETELAGVLRANLKRGVRYKYLIPREDGVLRQRMQRLGDKWKKECNLSDSQAHEQIQCFLVPAHFVYMTVVIYYPYTVPPIVLVKFPTSDLYSKEKYPLIYRVADQPEHAWRIFVQALQSLIDAHRDCPRTEALRFTFTPQSTV